MTEAQLDRLLHKWYGSGDKQGKRGGITYCPKPPYADRYRMVVTANNRTDPASIKLIETLKLTGWEWQYEDHDWEIERHEMQGGGVDRYRGFRFTFYPVFSEGRHVRRDRPPMEDEAKFNRRMAEWEARHPEDASPSACSLSFRSKTPIQKTLF